MPLGYECRSRLIKQCPVKPTEKRGKDSFKWPGPQQYEPAVVFGEKGYSHIKRAPAYTFGNLTKTDFSKPAGKPRLLNVRYMTKKGLERVTHGVISTLPPADNVAKLPGPGQYDPRDEVRHKRPPAYSMRAPPRPFKEPWDMWTPPPNMYLPALTGRKKPPAYSFGLKTKPKKSESGPGPGEYDAKYDLVWKKLPKFSFSGYTEIKSLGVTPGPNHYGRTQIFMTKPCPPAPSFGIRHSPFLGESNIYLKSSKLDLISK